MTIFNFGSINIDNVYRTDHLPVAGETLAAQSVDTGLGGKGANQSVAIARAGGHVCHIGAVGRDGAWCRDQMRAVGVDISGVAEVEAATGHANICVDPDGENLIVLYAGANQNQSLSQLKSHLDGATEGDTLILQNEVNLVLEAAKSAQKMGMRVIYSAAPFDAKAAVEILPWIDLLVLNEVEANQLSDALNVGVEEIDVPEVLITRGADGVVWREQSTGREIHMPAHQVEVVDTTGAGDCFIGYFAAGLDQGLTIEASLARGVAASALQVGRAGTADAIPDQAQVDKFLRQNG